MDTFCGAIITLFNQVQTSNNYNPSYPTVMCLSQRLLKIKSTEENMNQECIDHSQVHGQLANPMNPKLGPSMGTWEMDYSWGQY